MAANDSCDAPGSSLSWPTSTRSPRRPVSARRLPPHLPFLSGPQRGLGSEPSQQGGVNHEGVAGTRVRHTGFLSDDVAPDRRLRTSLPHGVPPPGEGVRADGARDPARVPRRVSRDDGNRPRMRGRVRRHVARSEELVWRGRGNLCRDVLPAATPPVRVWARSSTRVVRSWARARGAWLARRGSASGGASA